MLHSDRELEALNSLINTNRPISIKDALKELETLNNDVFETIHFKLDILIAKNLCYAIKES